MGTHQSTPGPGTRNAVTWRGPVHVRLDRTLWTFSQDYICGAFFLLLLWPPFVSPSALCSVTSPQGDSHTHPLNYSMPIAIALSASSSRL